MPRRLAAARPAASHRASRRSAPQSRLSLRERSPVLNPSRDHRALANPWDGVTLRPTLALDAPGHPRRRPHTNPKRKRGLKCSLAAPPHPSRPHKSRLSLRERFPVLRASRNHRGWELRRTEWHSVRDPFPARFSPQRVAKLPPPAKVPQAVAKSWAVHALALDITHKPVTGQPKTTDARNPDSPTNARNKRVRKE